MRNAEKVEAIMARRGEPIEIADHVCQFSWCTDTIWATSHSHYDVVDITGRRGDVVNGAQVTVVTDYDENEDVAPRILLHLGSDYDEVDVDVSPTAKQARRIAIAREAVAFRTIERVRPRPTRWGGAGLHVKPRFL